jgi:hypothetical protein
LDFVVECNGSGVLANLKPLDFVVECDGSGVNKQSESFPIVLTNGDDKYK